jgi:hypothetical protein
MRRVYLQAPPYGVDSFRGRSLPHPVALAEPRSFAQNPRREAPSPRQTKRLNGDGSSTLDSCRLSRMNPRRCVFDDFVGRMEGGCLLQHRTHEAVLVF